MNTPPPLVAKPYRNNAGVVLFNKDAQVLIGCRADMAKLNATHCWQMPQGGIDHGEDPFIAAKRELREETSVTSAELIAPAKDWLTYDFPANLSAKLLKGKYRGQRQMWYAMLFTGDDSEINVLAPDGGTQKAEFCEWRWEPLYNLPEIIVPFKHHIYTQLTNWFDDIPDKIRNGEIKAP